MARTSDALRDARIPLTAEARRSSFFVALVVVDVLAGLADCLPGLTSSSTSWMSWV